MPPKAGYDILERMEMHGRGAGTSGPSGSAEGLRDRTERIKMNRVCEKCGRIPDRADMRFCPYCGSALPLPASPEEGKKVGAELPEEAKKLLRKAEEAKSIPEKEKILLKAREAFPDCFPVEWELLFIGEKKKKGQKPGTFDYSVIKSYLLRVFQKPGLFTRERAEQDKKELFEGGQLTRCLAMSGEPEARMDMYLYRLCREYIEVFLEEDRTLTGGLLGFRIEKNHEKLISGEAAQIIRNIRADRELAAERREMLEESFLKAYTDHFAGKTENLDEKLAEV